MSTLAELPQETNSLLVSNLPGFITVEDLTANFQILGAVERVTILHNSNSNINGNENGSNQKESGNSGNLEAVIKFASSDDATRAARGVFSIFPEFSLWKVQISFTNARPHLKPSKFEMGKSCNSKKSVSSFGESGKKSVSAKSGNQQKKKKARLIISKSLFGAAFQSRTEIKKNDNEDSDNENYAESLRPSTVSSSLTTRKKRKVAEIRRKPVYKRRMIKLKRNDDENNNHKINKHNLSTIEEKSLTGNSEENLNDINHDENIQNESHHVPV